MYIASKNSILMKITAVTVEHTIWQMLCRQKQLLVRFSKCPDDAAHRESAQIGLKSLTCFPHYYSMNKDMVQNSCIKQLCIRETGDGLISTCEWLFMKACVRWCCVGCVSCVCSVREPVLAVSLDLLSPSPLTDKKQKSYRWCPAVSAVSWVHSATTPSLLLQAVFPLVYCLWCCSFTGQLDLAVSDSSAGEWECSPACSAGFPFDVLPVVLQVYRASGV